MGNRKLSGLTGTWSKYGGGKHAPHKSKIVGNWCCQSCGNTYPEQIKPQLYEFREQEYIRICATCSNNNCKSITARLQTQQSNQ